MVKKALVLFTLVLVLTVVGCDSPSEKYATSEVIPTSTVTTRPSPTYTPVSTSTPLLTASPTSTEPPPPSPTATVSSQESEDSGFRVSIILDDSLREEDTHVSAAWLGYGATRVEWVSENLSAEDYSKFGYQRSFEEEFSARETLAVIWTELETSQPGLTDQYLDQLVTVYHYL